MKHFSKLFLIALFTSSIIIFSCGIDSSTTPNTPPGTVLYRMDSISVWLQPSGSGSGRDSLYFSTKNTGGFKVELTLL